MQICSAEVFAETSHAEEELFSREFSRINHAKRICLAEVLAGTSQPEEDLFSGGACRNKPCREIFV